MSSPYQRNPLPVKCPVKFKKNIKQIKKMTNPIIIFNVGSIVQPNLAIPHLNMRTMITTQTTKITNSTMKPIIKPSFPGWAFLRCFCHVLQSNCKQPRRQQYNYTNPDDRLPINSYPFSSVSLLAIHTSRCTLCFLSLVSLGNLCTGGECFRLRSLHTPVPVSEFLSHNLRISCTEPSPFYR